jgi:hypothetical protein
MAQAKLITAGQKLMQGLSTKFMGDPYIAEAAVLVPSQFRDNNGTPGWFFGPNGVDYKFQYADSNSAWTAYNACPPLAAIINRMAQAYINGKTWVMNSDEKEATGPDANKIRKLLARPNPLRTWKQFEAELYIHLKLFSFSIALPISPFGFNKNVDATSIWLISPDKLVIKMAKKIFYNQQDVKSMFESISLKLDGELIPLDLDKIFIFRDFVPNQNNVVIPGSRIIPLTMPISNIIGTLESRGELINYAGSQGILTPEMDSSGPFPIKEEEKKQLQADFRRQYGIKRGQFRYIISPSPAKWQQMGRPTKDLMLFEEIQDDIMRLCDGLNFPYRLLSSDKSASYNDVHEFEKIFYQDTIIPESLDYYEQWNMFFGLDPDKMKLEKDYKHIAVLKSDAVEDGRASLYLNQSLVLQFTNNQLTWNEWRVANEQDTVPGMDLYYYQLVGEGKMFGAAPAPVINNSANNNDPANQNPPAK